ncbi:MAG: hypothetical protein PHQ12_14095 [Chthoniobacteraceae bacterium]|nr:hypothetical protein [Chthoniobacteraceae bacterium]
MKTFLILGIGLALAGTCAWAQPVVGLGRVESGAGNGAAVLGKNAPIPPETSLKAGPNGAILVFGDRSRIRLAPGSWFILSGGAPANPALEAPIEAPNATSALKSILTQRNAQRYRNEAELAVARDVITLQSGALIADQGTTTMDVRVMQQTLRSAEARFSVNVVSPESARLTVLLGTVTVAPDLATSMPVGAGEFSLLTYNNAGRMAASAPAKIAGSDVAMADAAALRMGQAGRLEPVGERTDNSKEIEPVGERLGDPGTMVGDPSLAPGPRVGTGPSVPFDLANPRTKSPKVLSTPNPINIIGPVQSPTQP